ncbi:MAG TPA: pyrimidine reductase family protein [Acidimicrobiales bacterium]|nr:pyrimidine reductase family protein [Acidimicrobiales bacterium]
MRRLVPCDEIDDPLEPYAGVDRRGVRPWVLANMVGGLDGSAAVGGRVGVLSGGADAELFRRMRALADVVLVGAETVRRERYGPVRLPDADRESRVAAGRPPVPPVAVVSRSLSIDWSIPLFATRRGPGEPRPMILTAAGADPGRTAEAATHADVVVAGEERVDVGLAVERLAGRGHRVVLCEGGPTLLGELVAAGLLDELCLTLSPVMGGDPLPIATVPPGGDLLGLRLAHVAVSDDVLFLRYERRTDGR